MQAILDDISFVLRSETKRYGARCVANMLPNFDQLENEIEILDFCPDPDLFAHQKTASTPLMSPIIVRMLLTNFLMVYFLLLNGGCSSVAEATTATEVCLTCTIHSAHIYLFMVK